MIWKIHCEEGDDGESGGAFDGRYWITGAPDGAALVLECGDALRGWQAATFEPGRRYAAETEPRDGEDAETLGPETGRYRWERTERGSAALVLCNGAGAWRLTAEAAEPLPPGAHGAVLEWARANGCAPHALPAVLDDGLSARTRAIERFCGLGRELDGDAFDAAVWRKALDGLSLDEIHGQLRALEVRFDQKHPPAPTSEPEPLDDTEPEGRQASALEILRG